MRYQRLECGIVIRINDDGTSDWPYGPRQGTTTSGEPATKEEFCAQSAIAWHCLMYLRPELERAVDYDLAFMAFGYAALTYNPLRGASLRTHCLRTFKYALQKRKEVATSQLSEHQGAENYIGQIDANVDIYKYRAALSREQWLLLLARYDSDLSYDEIAREFHFASRTTAMSKVAQALAVCQTIAP